MPELNWDNVQDFAPIPADLYDAEITGFKMTPESKSSGNPMVTYEATVLYGDYEGRKLWKNYSLTNQAAPYWKKFLVKCCGVSPEDFSGHMDWEKLTILAERAVGCKVKMDVSIKTLEDGEPVNDLRAFRPNTY